MFGHIPRDIFNKLSYGRLGPIAHERVWIDPRLIRFALPSPSEVGLCQTDNAYEPLHTAYGFSQERVGQVVGEKATSLPLQPLSRLRKIRACFLRWRDGVPWEATGAVDHLLFKIRTLDRPLSGCATREDVLRRYRRLDSIFGEVRRAGALRSSLRRGRLVWHERDGIQVHLGPGGEPIFGESGTHRLAMALVLGLDRVPASLGFVHESALPLLPDLRSCPVRSGLPKVESIGAASTDPKGGTGRRCSTCSAMPDWSAEATRSS